MIRNQVQAKIRARLRRGIQPAEGRRPPDSLDPKNDVVVASIPLAGIPCPIQDKPISFPR